MRDLINNLIHMTSGELFIRYWWQFIIITIICVIIMYFSYKKDKQRINKKYDNLEEKSKK